MKEFLDNFEQYIIASGLTIMTFITVANVFSRKVLHMSISFLEEITTIMFILISLLGAAVVAKKGGHLGLSAITDFIPQRYQKYVVLFTWVVATFFCYFLVKYGFVMVAAEQKMGIKTPSLGWPEWIFGMTLPVGGIFIFLRYTQFTIKMFRNKEAK
ncbi:MAG: TRAP transporter small permease [Lutisporaceae bacterium]